MRGNGTQNMNEYSPALIYNCFGSTIPYVMRIGVMTMLPFFHRLERRRRRWRSYFSQVLPFLRNALPYLVGSVLLHVRREETLDESSR